jgi:predicted dehydrogenase
MRAMAIDRRTFLAGTVAAAAATQLHASARGASGAGPASDRIRIGFAGMGARAQELVDAIAASGTPAEVVALCDAYKGRAERGRARAGGQAAIVDDYRRLLDDKTIDAVFIATPDHWHARMAVDAVSAGKDVYIEKPLTFTVDEGLEIARAVDRHGRLLQVGSQGVSGRRQAIARKIVKSGRLGTVTLVRAANHRNSDSGAWLYPIPPDASPETVDWKAFLGPAPQRPFSLERFFRWRCYWDYSGGLATDLFVHLLSWIHFVMDVQAPAKILGAGGTFVRKATHEVPDTLLGTLTYPEGFTAQLTCTLNSAAGSSTGIEILGTKAALRLRGDDVFLDEERIDQGGNGWVVRSWPEALEKAYYADPAVRAREVASSRSQEQVDGGERWSVVGEDDLVVHVRVFLDAVRSRKPVVEDARFGHRAAATAHLINRSLREGRVFEWDRGADNVRT